MKKVALVFALAVLLPSLVLAWLAVRSLRDQQFLLERQQSLLCQRMTDALAQNISDYLAQRQQEFQGFDLPAEFLLPLREIIGDVLRERICHALAQERLLAFEQKLLVAQRAHGQPREHEARQQDGEREDKRDFFHLLAG